MNEKDAVEKPRPSLGRALLPWTLLGIAVAIALVVLPLLKWGQGFEGPKHPAVGQKLTAVELTALTAQEPISLAELDGKVALFNFWGTWCYPCVLEMPHLSQLYQRLRTNDDFRFVSISCSGTDEEDLATLRPETQAFLEKHDYQFPTYADLDFMTRLEVARTAKMNSFVYPTTVLVDRDGTIQGLWTGYREGVVEEIERATRRLLAEEA